VSWDLHGTDSLGHAAGLQDSLSVRRLIVTYGCSVSDVALLVVVSMCRGHAAVAAAVLGTSAMQTGSHADSIVLARVMTWPNWKD